MRGIGWRTAVILGLLANCAVTGWAEGPGFSLLPFKRVDADPKKDYSLTEGHGPWMILASSFAGEGAETQAQQLVIELRRDFKLLAYTHKQHYDFSKSFDGVGVNKYGDAKKMKNLHGRDFDEIAVLVGNFPSLDDANLQKALQTLKYATCTVSCRPTKKPSRRGPWEAPSRRSIPCCRTTGPTPTRSTPWSFR
jgi:hypothetical protein